MNTLRKVSGIHKLPYQIYVSRATFSSGEIPRNILEEQGLVNGQLQKENGKIYDKKPFKMTLEENKKYSWCLCGHSKNNPICDGTHKNVHLKLTLKPVKFAVAKSGDYWLCNCKHTKNRPFCDGTHKTLAAQEGK
uniref:CSON010621 protein n=1 Tax=Culicoides sonorensis TaxID=179676 RepID=A0A336KPQ3_CULSO